MDEAISCQACRQSQAIETNSTDDRSQPYQLCTPCNSRLTSRSLRPIEWLNLAAIHGPNKFLLHGDFYDDDGTAWQPEAEVVDPHLHLTPDVQDIAGDLDRLLDLAMAGWHLNNDIATALGAHSAELVLARLDARVNAAPNPDIEFRAYEICARSLARNGGPWVRSRSPQTSAALFYWAKAAAACLPVDEAWPRAVDALRPNSDLRVAAGALSWFRSERALDWLEATVSAQPTPVHREWGRLAACSQLSWERIELWLSHGRPLSLVALDALASIFERDTPQLKQLKPLLVGPVEPSVLGARLDRYLEEDDVPRVQRRVQFIRANFAIDDSLP